MNLEMIKMQLNKEAEKKFFDKVMYIGSLFGPFVLIPQIIQVWINQDASGISIITWALLAGGSFMWFVYGLLHDEKPLVLTNFILLICDLVIIVGVLLYR